MSNKNEIVQVSQQAPIKSSLQNIGAAIQQSIICKSNCKLCNSKARMQAQKAYDQGISTKRIHAILITQHKQDISYRAVNNHFQQHYSRQKTQMQMKQYLQDLNKYKAQKQNRAVDLMDRKTAISKMFFTLSAKHDVLTDLQQIRKNVAALKTVGDMLSSVQAQIDVLKKQSQPIVLVLQKLAQIVKQRSQKTQNQQVKQELHLVIKQLSAQCQGIFAT